MVASIPPMVMSAMLTTLPMPTVLFAKVAVAPLWSRVTVSLASTPDNAADVLTKRAVAEVVRS